jgi:hypothetical protein
MSRLVILLHEAPARTLKPGPLSSQTGWLGSPKGAHVHGDHGYVAASLRWAMVGLCPPVCVCLGKMMGGVISEVAQHLDEDETYKKMPRGRSASSAAQQFEESVTYLPHAPERQYM